MGKTVIDGWQAQVAGRQGARDLGLAAMTYEAIRKFADATGDHQWIHVDRERIARSRRSGSPSRTGTSPWR